MDNTLIKIGQHIRHYRIEKKLTQQELAEMSDLSLPFMNQVENGHRNISLKTLIKILDSLEVSLGEFFQPFSDKKDSDLIQELILTIHKSGSSEQLTKLFIEFAKLSER